jgi:D-glycero-alpha-D-manno-heptose-7-phosphate kinase
LNVGAGVIIIQTPLRVSLFGGGTDFPSFYLNEGGCVLTSAINKYIFITIKERFDHKLRIGWTRTEMVDCIEEIQHELIREALKKTGISRGVEITTMGDIPAAGSGLGSSSTVTVGSLHAMYTYLGQIVPADRLASEACEIEIETLNKPIGVQDQYIAALGGLQFLEFKTNGEITNEKISLDSCLKRRLNESLLLFYTGVPRRADDILGEQKKNIDLHLHILREMKNMAQYAKSELKTGNLDIIGGLLHESWQLKKQLASQISNGTIDAIYNSARKAGALGGKITGAGGGGFFLFYCPLEKRESVRAALGSLQELPIQLETDGTKVIFNYHR